MAREYFVNRAFEDDLNARGIPYRCMWEEKIRNVGMLTCFLVQQKIVMHLSYKGGMGWDVFLPAQSNLRAETIDEVIAKTKVEGVPA